MTVDEVLASLQARGSDKYRRVLRAHGAPDTLLGVSVADLKGVMKQAGRDHALALALWATGVPDAQYLGGLMVDPKKMTVEELDGWARTATWSMVAEYSVPWVAAEAGHGWACGLRWIDDADDSVASSGWAALASHVALTADEQLDLRALDALLDRCVQEIHQVGDRVRYTMNGFVIAVGGYVAPRREAALATAAAIGAVHVDQGGTACAAPDARAAIAKMAEKGVKKRRTVRC